MSAEYPSGNGVAGAPDTAFLQFDETDAGPIDIGFSGSIQTVKSLTFTLSYAGELVIAVAFEYSGAHGDSGHRKSTFVTQSASTSYGIESDAAGATRTTQVVTDRSQVAAGAAVTCGLAAQNSVSSTTMRFWNVSIIAKLNKVG